MSGYLNDHPGYPKQGDNAYGWPEQDNQGTYNFDMSGSQFGQELNFQTFDGTQSGDPGYATGPAYAAGGNPYLNPSPGQQAYQGEIFTPRQEPSAKGFAGEGGDNFEEEPPLLEELGINPDHIVQKTLAALNPFRATDAGILQDNDLAGPLVFCLIFGGLLLLSGKVHFSYIYGIGVMGCLAVYALLTLMSATAVTLGNVVSVLGYCLLPMVGLSAVNVILSLQGLIGIILTGMAIFWCSLSASKLFVTALSMQNQQILIAYPCALLYGVFALITIF